jgi:hypothetical protein
VINRSHVLHAQEIILRNSFPYAAIRATEISQAQRVLHVAPVAHLVVAPVVDRHSLIVRE